MASAKKPPPDANRDFLFAMILERREARSAIHLAQGTSCVEPQRGTSRIPVHSRLLNTAGDASASGEAGFGQRGCAEFPDGGWVAILEICGFDEWLLCQHKEHKGNILLYTFCSSIIVNLGAESSPFCKK